MGKLWYSIQVWAGKEREIQEKVKEALEEKGFSDRVEEFFVPPSKKIEVVFSPEKVEVKRFYSGYFLIYGELEKEIIEEIKGLEGVLDIVGGDKLHFFRNEEIEKLKSQLVVEEIKPKPRYQFMVGDKVKILEGPFANFIGVVEEVRPDKGKARILVSIFGRETPLDIDFMNLQKL